MTGAGGRRREDRSSAAVEARRCLRDRMVIEAPGAGEGGRLVGIIGGSGRPGPRARRILRFAVVGIAATTAHAAATVLLVNALAADPTLAMVIGTVVGVATSYLGNALWTFTDAGSHARQLPRFLLVYGTIMGFNALTMFVLEALLGLCYLIPLALALTVAPALTFVLNERYVFPGRSR